MDFVSLYCDIKLKIKLYTNMSLGCLFFSPTIYSPANGISAKDIGRH